MPDNNVKDLLRSWKEIASYLGCDSRTCHRWEKRFALPVHRAGASLRSSVFAYKSELDSWLREKGPETRYGQEFLRKRAFWKKRYWIFLPLGAVILSFFVLSGLRNNAQPSDFRIDKSDLVILDRKGRELGRFPTGVDNLQDDAFYRQRYQVKKLTGDGPVVMPVLMIKDINNDGRAEVLFSIKTQNEYGEGTLYCLNYKGQPLWSFKAGREMKYGKEIYSGDYRIIGLGVCDLNNDGNQEILVISAQKPEWPCQFVVLDSKGQKLSEYWNSGHFVDYLICDSAQQKKRDIVLAGVNNETEGGCLTVFDPSLIRGGSPQNDDAFKCPSLEAGTQKYYIRFPRTDVDLLEYPQIGVAEIEILANHTIQARMNRTSLFFEFNDQFELLDIKNSHAFKQMYKEALLGGKVKSFLTEAYWEKLKHGVFYWDGENWTPRPTMNLRFWASKN